MGHYYFNTGSSPARQPSLPQRQYEIHSPDGSETGETEIPPNFKEFDMFLRLSMIFLIAFLASCASRPYSDHFDHSDHGSRVREARIR